MEVKKSCVTCEYYNLKTFGTDKCLCPLPEWLLSDNFNSQLYSIYNSIYEPSISGKECCAYKEVKYK